MFTGTLSRRSARGPLCAGTVGALVVVLIAVAPGAALPPTWPGAPEWWPDENPFSGTLGDLEGFIDLLQQSLERLTAWIQLFQRGTADMLTGMIWEQPGLLPDEAGLPVFLSQLAAVPSSLRSALQTVATKLSAPLTPGSVDARHHGYIESNATLVDQAVGIAQTDEVVAGGIVQQQAASEAATLAAASASRDRRPASATLEAGAASDALASSAQDLPSSRAGIELLVAGMGAGLRQQADLGAATADRLTVLAQQTAQVSQQMDALAVTTGALALRDAERDRRTLSDRLGLADATSAAGQVLQDALSGAGDAAVADPVLQPLY